MFHQPEAGPPHPPTPHAEQLDRCSFHAALCSPNILPYLDLGCVNEQRLHLLFAVIFRASELRAADGEDEIRAVWGVWNAMEFFTWPFPLTPAAQSSYGTWVTVIRGPDLLGFSFFCILFSHFSLQISKNNPLNLLKIFKFFMSTFLEVILSSPYLSILGPETDLKVSAASCSLQLFSEPHQQECLLPAQHLRSTQTHTQSGGVQLSKAVLTPLSYLENLL